MGKKKVSTIKMNEMINIDRNLQISVKISIVIPVYNVERYLCQCLDSVINQTLNEIEIICVNDNSTDGSLDILREYAAKDERVKVVNLIENYSASIARKIGVQMVSGDYILFMDSDDFLELNACEYLYENINEYPVEILHFGTNIINRDNLPQARINSMQKFVSPFIGEISGRSVFESCFIEKKYKFSLWNKLYKTELVKKAFLYVENTPLPKAQDMYAFFIISYFAESYRGIEDKFYNYNFGAGITGHEFLDLNTFEKYCKMGLTADKIKKFALLMNDPVCEKAGERTLYYLLDDCVANWNRLSDADTSVGFDLILDYFDRADVVSAIAKKLWWDFDVVVPKIFNAKKLNIENKKIKTIATYYHKLESGGVQRVLVELAKLWLDMGYNVIIMTDLPPSEGDYELPKNITRIILPSFFAVDKENYIDRAKAIQKITKEYDIDLVVYHAWVSNILLWDLLIFKLNNIKFSIHCHNIYSMLTINRRTSWSGLPYVYSLADGVITLSDVDKQYWSNFNDNVIEVINPLSFGNIENCRVSSLTTHNIIWCARLSEEKNPLDAIDIFNIVHQSISTAKLFILGQGTSSFYLNEIKKKISTYNIEQDVILCGYQKNPRVFYELSSINLITSEYEGYPLTLFESMVFGLPTVMYELPYLSLVRSGKGIIAIKNRNKTNAAQAIIELLRDDDQRKRLGKEARDLAEETAQFDYRIAWKEFFDKTEKITSSKKIVPIFWSTLLSHYKKGVVKSNNEIKKISSLEKKNKESEKQIKELKEKKFVYEKQIKELEKKNTEYEKQLNMANYHISEIWKSRSFKLARLISWLPRKINDLFKKY